LIDQAAMQLLCKVASHTCTEYIYSTDSVKIMGLEINKVKYKDSWRLVRLKELCDKITDGTHFTPKYIEKGIPFISVKDIFNEKVHFENCKYISVETHQELIKRCNPEKDDILITKSGTIGRMALVPDMSAFSLFVSVALIKNKKNLIGSKFLKYTLQNFLNSINISQDIKGGLLKNFHLEDIRETLMPLVSVEEQQAIVSKIEELFSELDKGIEQLKTAKQQLKTYRQSVLKWAFEGKLTNENVKDGELPEGWKWKTLKEVTSLLGDGLHGTPRYTDSGDCYFINGNNLCDGKIVFKASTKKVSFDEIQKHKKNLNDSTILVSINGTLGNTAFYNGEKVILGKSACFFNLTNEADKHFVRYIITSQRFLNFANNSATGSTIPNVSLKSMREFGLPIPPIEEQYIIVQEIESRLSVADKMEETISQSLQQAEALRQSILKKAFEGRLVATD
jgi:type I restriction enzyme S subunit